MKILVTFAVGTEFAAWRRQHDFRQVSHEPFAVYAAEIGGNTVRALLTGIGATAAEAAMRWALAIARGYLHVQRLCRRVDARIEHWQRARRACSGCAPNANLPWLAIVELLAIACEAGARQVDRFLTSEHLVVSAAEKAALAGQADAVEMESFVILAEAARHGVRAVAIRAISDAANHVVALSISIGRAMREGEFG